MKRDCNLLTSCWCCSTGASVRLSRAAPDWSPTVFAAGIRCEQFGLRVLEASYQPGRSLHMVLERSGQLFPGQARLQRFRVEVGGDQRPRVMMPVGIRRGAWAEINGLLHRALATDKFVGRLAQFAFGEPLGVCGDTVSHHVRHASRRTTFGIEQQERE